MAEFQPSFFFQQRCPNLGMTLTKLVYDEHGQSYEPLKKRPNLGVEGKLRKNIKRKYFSKKAKFRGKE